MANKKRLTKTQGEQEDVTIAINDGLDVISDAAQDAFEENLSHGGNTLNNVAMEFLDNASDNGEHTSKVFSKYRVERALKDPRVKHTIDRIIRNLIVELRFNMREIERQRREDADY
jgi:hypothetical protein